MANQLTEISGQIERISFSNEDTGFAVIAVKIAGQRDTVTAVGQLNNPVAGEFVDLFGEYKRHPKFGMNFNVDHYKIRPPNTLNGLKKYLGSGLIKGIGQVLAERMVNAFGERILEVLDNEPERLTEVPGLGAMRRENIIEAWKASTGLKRLLEFLAKYGLGPSLASKILKKLGPEAESIIRTDPYCLSYEVDGVGFATADKVAQSLNFMPDSPERLDAALLYIMSESTQGGHDFLPSQELFSNMNILLKNVDQDLLQQSLSRSAMTGRIITEKQDQPGGVDVYLPKLHRAEVWVARNLASIAATPFGVTIPRPEKALKWVEKDLGLELNEDQRQAVMACLTQKLVVVTGGPGTGKTTMTKAVSRIWRAVTPKVALVAPTGRAAKKLNQATGLTATTIHRLLEYSVPAKGFIKGPNNRLDLNMLLVDESSMLDIQLINNLLGALPPQASLILIGDQDQLPSVGPGKVLADIISSGKAKVHRLSHIFRQAKESLIITAAHLINQGRVPDSSHLNTEADFHFVEEDDPDRIREKIVKLVSERIPKKLGLNPLTDIQVLTPIHRGELGTRSLNSLLSQILNPTTGPVLHRFSQQFKKGDRVMQIRNNYNREVYNGDMGVISLIDHENQELTVEFEEKPVTYDYSDVDELLPAWAISVHKSQGSEFPAIVMPIHTSHYIMLKRNLLYTAVTRGRQMVFLIGSTKALKIAVDNNTESERYSHLAFFLKNGPPSNVHADDFF